MPSLTNNIRDITYVIQDNSDIMEYVTKCYIIIIKENLNFNSNFDLIICNDDTSDSYSVYADIINPMLILGISRNFKYKYKIDMLRLYDIIECTHVYTYYNGSLKPLKVSRNIEEDDINIIGIAIVYVYCWGICTSGDCDNPLTNTTDKCFNIVTIGELKR